MILRFLAAFGPEDQLGHLSEQAARVGLRAIPGPGRPFVWTAPATPTVGRLDGEAVLIGFLFERASGHRVASLSGQRLDERITRGHWGPYVLVTRNERGHAVLRDPSGAIPVYYGACGALTLYASDAQLLGIARSEPFQPDLGFIRHWLSYPYLRAARTGIDGVRELVPGTCRRVTAAGETITASWSPVVHARRQSGFRNVPAAADLLRNEMLKAIPAISASGSRPVLQLSGGLDSSLVAAALAHGHVPFSALTFATRSPDGDERRFAREMAARCGSALVELAEEDLALDLRPSAENPLRPGPSPALRPLHRAVTEAVEEIGGDLVLDGAGGDNVFAYLSTTSPALDAFRYAGAAAGLRTLRDIANLHGCTFWTATRLALRRARRVRPAAWRGDTSFLAPAAVVEEPEFHPWLADSSRLPPGKADHLRMIVGIHHFLADPEPGRPARLRPLLAQPLLETCLSIPSWLWVAGGRDRAVAREAFRDLLPASILNRRGKGRLESMFLRSYMAARPRLESFLREGRLAAEGILDGAAVSAYLRAPGEPSDGGYVRLLDCAAAELWLQSFGS